MDRLNEAAWADVLRYLRQHHPELQLPGLGQIEPPALEHGQLVVEVADPAVRRYLEDRCRLAFVDAAQAVTGHLVSVRFDQAPPDEEHSAERLGGSLGLPSLGLPGGSAGLAPAAPALRLNPLYVFDHFVTGPENRLACASCRAVAEGPGRTYNPLFIYGNSGLGKTHLLQAICHEILERSPAARIAYLTCEEFVNHFIDAIGRGALHEFRYRYRHADALIIDDIQFLTVGERSQDEFFHTFNTLYQAQRQIVLSSDCAPAEIPGLTERLISRFQWGLVARIDPLCVETRIAILRTKARVKGINVADEALDFIGTHVRGNAREIEGALAQVKAAADVAGEPLTLELARRALGALVEGPRRPAITLQNILSEVTDRFPVKLSELRGPRRHRSVALARQVCMYLARRLTDQSLDEIGGYFGGRDHTTVLHAQRIIAERREDDAKLSALLDEIEQKLTQT